MIKRISILLMAAAGLAACGSGNTEKVTADSTVTSASVVAVPAPAIINTDTTTAAPVAVKDTTAKKPVPKVKKPAPKPVHKPVAKPGAKGKPAPHGKPPVKKVKK